MPVSERPRCYVASPMGFSEATRPWYRDVFLPALADVVDPVDPWSLTSEEEVVAAFSAGTHVDLWRAVGQRNIAAIDSCQLLVAQLDGQEVDAGTASEVGYAAAKGLTCHGLRTDLRQAGELGMPVNLQLVAFVESSGGAVHGTLADLLAALR